MARRKRSGCVNHISLSEGRGNTRPLLYMIVESGMVLGVFDVEAIASSSDALMKMLPKPIIDEIFNLRYQVSDAAIDHICDELHRYGCVVDNHCNYDTSVILYFSRSADAVHPRLEGELRIDRIERQFDIAARYGEETILPASGDWSLVEEYLQKVLEAA